MSTDSSSALNVRSDTRMGLSVPVEDPKGDAHTSTLHSVSWSAASSEAIEQQPGRQAHPGDFVEPWPVDVALGDFFGRRRSRSRGRVELRAVIMRGVGAILQ
jgi:hypothetical protein